MRFSDFWRAYAAGVLLTALASVGYMYSIPIDCGDGYGHGPDPDTRECLIAIERGTERKPYYALGLFITIIAVGASAAGVVVVCRKLHKRG